MNHWPDGTKLTAEDMVTIGIDAGLWTHEEALALPGVHEKKFTSFVIQHTAKARLDMMWEGKLVLRTAIRDIPESPRPQVEAWVFELEKASK